MAGIVMTSFLQKGRINVEAFGTSFVEFNSVGGPVRIELIPLFKKKKRL